MNSYYFDCPTHWRVKGAVEDVYDIITQPLEFPRWWSNVYLTVREISPGGEQGTGRIVESCTKGRLPFVINWRAQVIASERPTYVALRAFGDLEGKGEWRFSQSGEWVDIYYDWKVFANKPWMRKAYFLLKPLFEANHRWAMRHGERGLRCELSRRQSPGEK